MAEGIQIGRGYIAVDLDEAGARASLDVLVEKIKEALREASKKTELDLDDTKADAELDKTDAKIKKVQRDAQTPVTFGSGITEGARAAQQAIESASAAVASARAKEENAAGRVRVAEQQLADVRAKEESVTGRIRVAEQQLTEARAKYAADSSQVLGAEERLAAARREIAASAARITSAEERLAAAERGVATAADSSRVAELKLANARDASLDKLAKAKKDASDGGDPFKGWGAALSGIFSGKTGGLSVLGLWAPAITAVTLAAQSGAGSILSLVGAAGNLLGVVGLVPAVGFAAASTIAALVVGFKGIGTALTQANSPAQLKAQNAALAGLAPNAKEFVKAVQGIKPALADLRLADQNALFAGLGQTIKTVATVEIPVLKAGLAGVAGAVGAGLGGLLGSIGGNKSLWDQALIFTNIKDTLQRLLPSLMSFWDILTSVAVVGSGFLPQMATHFTDLLAKFALFIQQARDDGSLKQWVQSGITAIDALGRVVGNIGSILGALFQAGQTAGANFLGTLSQITGQFAAFLHTAQGQSDLATILGSASDATKVLVPLLKDALNTLAGFAPILSPIANILAPAVDQVIQALGPALQNLDPGLKALATGIAAILGAVSQLLGPVSRLASDLAVGLGVALQVVAHILTALAPLLSGIASVVDFLAHSTGALIPILAVAALGFLALSKAGAAVATNSAAATTAVAALGLRAGVAVEAMTGSAAAGVAVASLGSKVGTALKGVGSALPFVGIALLGVGAIIQAVQQHAKALAQEAQDVGKGLVVGGSAGVEAAQKMAQYQKAVDDAADALARLRSNQPTSSGGKAGGEGPQSQQTGAATGNVAAAQQQLDAAKHAADAYRASLSDTQLAQARVAQAQLDYNNAVRQFGGNSAQAQSALLSLKGETQHETDAEYAATQATESHQQALKDLLDHTIASANASANLKLAQLDLADAQKAATDAIKASGAGSVEAQRAEAQYELQLNQTVQAMHDKAMADYAALPPSFQLAATNADVTKGILDLALAAGKNAPPALQALVEKTYDANQAAIAAGANVAGLHQQVVTLPDGKTISIYVDSNGQAYVQGLQSSLDSLVSRQYVARVQLQGPSGPFSIVPVAKASGGPVKAGAPYWVGEHGPELVVPHRDGYVVPSSESRVAMASAAAHAGGPTVNQYNSFPIGLSEQQVADMSANSAAWKLRTAR